LTQVARPIGAHWQVDYFNQLHFAVTEAGSDPLALSPRHPTMQHLSITDDLSQVVNRVTVHYDRVTVKAALVDAEIAVDSLDGYSPSGGLASIGGNTVTYAGTRSALIDPVYGHVPVDIRQTAVEIAGEGFAEWTSCGYSLSLSTSLGETPLVAGRSGYALISPDTAFDLTLTELYGSPAAVARVTRVNIYRNSNEGAGVTFLVGSVLPTVGSRFTDRTPLADIPTPLIQAPSVNSADARGYWLTGCSGSQDVHTPASVMVEDPDAQDALAALLGGADDGIIEASLQGGTITTAEAITLATTYLNTQSGIRTSVSCDVRDDKAHPGQVLSVNFPAPIDCVADLKIQSTSISDLEPGVPHKYSVVAANDLVTMEDILKHSSVGSP
jgi:hypothetical protein